MLPTALALAVSIPLANAAGFEVELQPDIVQRRDVVDPGNQVVELVRILPPDEEPWTLIVHVPNSWVDASRGADRTPALVSSASGAQTRALVQAVMRDVSGASSLGGMQAAGLWAGLLRCSSFASPVPVSHYDTVLEPWEVLYDAQAGDTLSSSLSALMALEQLGVAARLARYPTPATSSGVAFGLAIDGQAPAKADWAWPVQGADPPAVVLPLHLKAKPQGDLAIDQLHSWTLQMVLGADWSPGVEPTTDALTDPNPNPDPDPDPDPKSDPDPDPDPAPAPPQRRTPRPDICSQAEAMGLACRPVDRSNDPLYIGLAILALAGVAAGGIGSLVARSRRQARARQRSQRRRNEDF